MTSWDEAFAVHYDAWAAEMVDDVAFYVALARQADGPIVELAVGSGRVAIPVARATGRTVIGIDTSPSMLAQARERSVAAGVQLDLRQLDMRELALEAPAALIYCPANALMHLPTWTDRRKTFERVASSLRPGARFAWNAFAFSHHVAAELDGMHRDRPVPHSVHYRVGDNRVDLDIDDGGRSSLWWATRNEWLGLIDVAGLEVESLSGGLEGEPFTDDAGLYVFTARRPAIVAGATERATRLLERMVGAWVLVGEMGSTPLRQHVGARWALGGRYVEMRCTQQDAPGGAVPYEAVYHIGFEPSSGTMVMHLLDSTGVVAERSVGRGIPEADAVTFTFPYLGGPFTNRFTYDSRRDSWTHELSARQGAQATPFATKHLTRIPGEGE
jgi:SAM-dependent methyltransferase